MKAVIIFSSVVVMLSGCGKITIEEYLARVKYCEDNGFTYEAVQKNGFEHTWVYCTKDGKRFDSKWEDE